MKVENHLCEVTQLITSRRRRDTSVVTIEKLFVEFPLERLDVGRHTGLCIVKIAGGARDRAGTQDMDEGLQMDEVQHSGPHYRAGSAGLTM